MSRRERAPYRSERHAALDTQYPSEFTSTQFASTQPAAWPTSTLPKHRQLVHGRTHDRVYDRSAFAAIEKPERQAARRVRDIAFGIAMAVVVALAIVAILYSRQTP